MIKLIVAKSKNDVIGKDNNLIWNLPADMRHFTNTTLGGVVIMGRRNWDSIPAKYRPLKDRINVVITRNKDFKSEGCLVFNSIEEAISFYKLNPAGDIFIIGGGQIYNHALEKNLVDEMIITEIDAEFEGDTCFPKVDELNWTKTLLFSHAIDDKNPYSFNVWTYTKK